MCLPGVYIVVHTVFIVYRDTLSVEVYRISYILPLVYAGTYMSTMRM